MTLEPTEAMVEAAHDADPWIYGQDVDGENVYKPWFEAPDSVKTRYRKGVTDAFAAAPPEWLLRAALSKPQLELAKYALEHVEGASRYEQTDLYAKLSRALRGGEET